MKHIAEQFTLPMSTPEATPEVPPAPLPLSADEIRSKLVALFNTFKPAMQQYYDYARQAAALSEEYHVARLKEFFPEAIHNERVLLGTLDARETPTTLDLKLMKLKDAKVSLIVFDRINATYYLYS